MKYIVFNGNFLWENKRFDRYDARAKESRTGDKSTEWDLKK